jgi:hypothetical protein
LIPPCCCENPDCDKKTFKTFSRGIFRKNCQFSESGKKMLKPAYPIAMENLAQQISSILPGYIFF